MIINRWLLISIMDYIIDDYIYIYIPRIVYHILYIDDMRKIA